MKTRNVLSMLVVILLVVTSQVLNAQSYRKVLKFHGSGIAWCLNREVITEGAYNLIYHVDQKTGTIDRMHSNLLYAETRDAETGEKFIMIDTSNDNLGSWFGFYNKPNESNGVPDYSLYEVHDGWLDDVMLADLPFDEGSMVYSTLKFIAKGGFKVSMHMVWQFHMNANGEMTAEVIHEKYDCNE